ncbi:MAG: LarC family nickel insertion protein, partial [Oscillospiraceae bacterium]|nr:LarC family nickel insertion protein [Oscillospiraceae bacterium]
MKNEVVVHARVHDVARVVSAEFEVGAGGVNPLLDAVKAEMSRVNQWADGVGAIIGHLKGYIEPCEGAFTLSTTGGAVSVSGELTFDVGVTGIIFGAELTEVQEQIILLSQNVLSAFGVTDAEIEICDEEHEHSHEHAHSYSGLNDIEALIASLPVDAGAKEDAARVYRLIADAEAHAHG